jgi:hypothetical protein
VFSPCGLYIATSDASGTTLLWSVNDGFRNTSTIAPDPQGKPVRALVFTPDNNLLVLSTEEGSVRVYDWRIKSKAPFGPVRTFKAHSKPITAMASSEDGTRFLTASMDCTACVWRSPQLEFGEPTAVSSRPWLVNSHTASRIPDYAGGAGTSSSPGMIAAATAPMLGNFSSERLGSYGNGPGSPSTPKAIFPEGLYAHPPGTDPAYFAAKASFLANTEMPPAYNALFHGKTPSMMADKNEKVSDHPSAPMMPSSDAERPSFSTPAGVHPYLPLQPSNSNELPGRRDFSDAGSGAGEVANAAGRGFARSASTYNPAEISEGEAFNAELIRKLNMMNEGRGKQYPHIQQYPAFEAPFIPPPSAPHMAPELVLTPDPSTAERTIPAASKPLQGKGVESAGASSMATLVRIPSMSQLKDMSAAAIAEIPVSTLVYVLCSNNVGLPMGLEKPEIVNLVLRRVFGRSS